MEIFIFVICIAIIVIYVFISFRAKEDIDRIKQNRDKKQNELNNKYDEIFCNVRLPKYYDEIYFLEELIISGKNIIKKSKYYFWIDEKYINFFPKRKKIWYEEEFNKIVKYKKIDLDKVKYFSLDGEVYHENKITGGGGGGSSVGKAITGAIVAGEVGAIVASRNKVQPIKSELIKHDERKIIIKYIDESGSDEILMIEYSYYDKLIELIPEKQKSFIEAKKNLDLLNDNETILRQIQKLAELRDEGVLNEEEFTAKKKFLLEKIT